MQDTNEKYENMTVNDSSTIIPEENATELASELKSMYVFIAYAFLIDFIFGVHDILKRISLSFSGSTMLWNFPSKRSGILRLLKFSGNC